MLKQHSEFRKGKISDQPKIDDSYIYNLRKNVLQIFKLMAYKYIEYCKSVKKNLL